MVWPIPPLHADGDDWTRRCAVRAAASDTRALERVTLPLCGAGRRARRPTGDDWARPGSALRRGRVPTSRPIWLP